MSNVVDLHGVTQARTNPYKRALAAQLLSDRHRLWGYDCAAVDVDFIPYDLGLPTGLIEYKNEHGAPLDLANEVRPRRPLGVLRTLSDAAKQPLFICRYTNDFSTFKVQAVNDLGASIVPRRTLFDEVDYVHFLYGLGTRARRVPRRVQEYLNGQPRLDF